MPEFISLEESNEEARRREEEERAAQQAAQQTNVAQPQAAKPVVKVSAPPAGIAGTRVENETIYGASNTSPYEADRINQASAAQIPKAETPRFVSWVDNNDTKLAPYVVRTPTPFKEAGKIEGYNLAKYLADGGDPAYLQKQGFKADDINAAQQYVNQPFVGKNPSQDYYNALSKFNDSFPDASKFNSWRDWDNARSKAMSENAELQGLKKAMETAPTSGQQTPKMSSANFRDVYLKAHGFTKAPDGFSVSKPITQWSDHDKAYQATINAANAEYQRVYGNKAYLESTFVDLGSYVFSPVRIAQPDVEFKDISGAEWAIGAGQVATTMLSLGGGSMVSAGVPKLLIKGLEIGATGTMAGFGTYETVKNWESMTPAQRAFAVTIDAALIAATGKAMIDSAKAIRPNQKITAAKYIDDLTMSAEPESIAKSPDRFIVGESRTNIEQVTIRVKDPVTGKYEFRTIDKVVKSSKTADTVAAYREMVLDQADYAKGIKNEVTIQKRIDVKTASLNNVDKYITDPDMAKAVKARLESQLKTLGDQLDNVRQSNTEARINLQKSTKGYADELRDAFQNANAGADEPVADIMSRSKLKDTLDDLPRDIPRETETIVRELMQNKSLKQRIASLEREVSSLRSELNTMRQKHPTNPSAYSDISAELAAKEAHLSVLKLGDVKALQVKLTELRDHIDDLNSLKETKGLTERQRLKIQKDLNVAEKQASELNDQLKASLNQADEIVSVEKIYNPKTDTFEYKPLEPMSGGTKTKIDIKTGKPIIGGGESAPTVSRIVEGSVFNVTRPKIQTIDTSEPAPVPFSTPHTTTTAPETTPDTAPRTTQAPKTSPDETTKPDVDTKSNTEDQTGTVKEPDVYPVDTTKPAQDQRPDEKPKPDEKTDWTTKTPPNEYKPPPKEPTVFEPPVDDKGQHKFKNVPKGAFGVVSQHQGLFWLTRWYPYRQVDAIYTKKKPREAIAARDSKSAYDTIQTITGIPPNKLPKFDMGIFDIYVKNPPKEPTIRNRSAISFVKDLSRIKSPTTRARRKARNLGAGIVETMTRHGRHRHVKLT